MPDRAVDADPSNVVADPAGAGVAVNAASGAWSGMTAIAFGPEPTGIGDPVVLVAMSIGMTLLLPRLAT